MALSMSLNPGWLTVKSLWNLNHSVEVTSAKSLGVREPVIRMISVSLENVAPLYKDKKS